MPGPAPHHNDVITHDDAADATGCMQCRVADLLGEPSPQHVGPAAASDDLLALVVRLADRLLDLERRLAAAGIANVEPLERQRKRGRRLLEESSPVARYVAGRQRVLGGPR